ncbi:hypothetical protein HPB50_015316 [Hyalomma asiaticum]|uniref:Uncharacterized protein n=1 Tax=Hyalomma asiaticum TaxID=266040 RepID=A0ACB7TN59_HYAAI|nr:hypothetical protein HPB50_015316 [Hyalomma asiaticum]
MLMCAPISRAPLAVYDRGALLAEETGATRGPRSVPHAPRGNNNVRARQVPRRAAERKRRRGKQNARTDLLFLHPESTRGTRDEQEKRDQTRRESGQIHRRAQRSRNGDRPGVPTGRQPRLPPAPKKRHYKKRAGGRRNGLCPAGLGRCHEVKAAAPRPGGGKKDKHWANGLGARGEKRKSSRRLAASTSSGDTEKRVVARRERARARGSPASRASRALLQLRVAGLTPGWTGNTCTATRCYNAEYFHWQ